MAVSFKTQKVTCEACLWPLAFALSVASQKRTTTSGVAVAATGGDAQVTLWSQ